MDTRDEAILSAAAELFREGGLAAVTIRAVSARADASTGSIYHRFGDRAGILVALAAEAFQQGTLAMDRALQDHPEAEQAVRAMVLAWIDWVLEHPDLARRVYEIPISPELDPRREELAELKRPLFAPIFDRVGRELLAGRIRPLPAAALDPIVFGPAHELCRRWLADPRMPLHALRYEVAEAVWRAVAPDPRAAS